MGVEISISTLGFGSRRAFTSRARFKSGGELMHLHSQDQSFQISSRYSQRCRSSDAGQLLHYKQLSDGKAIRLPQGPMRGLRRISE